jgi:hypothetical protein
LLTLFFAVNDSIKAGHIDSPDAESGQDVDRNLLFPARQLIPFLGSESRLFIKPKWYRRTVIDVKVAMSCRISGFPELISYPTKETSTGFPASGSNPILKTSRFRQ